MAPTTMARGARALALAAAAAVVVPLLGGCTPRAGYAALDNRTSFDLVASEGGRLSEGGADPHQTGSIYVGDPGDCLDSVHVATADGSRVAVIDRPVCDEDELVIEEADLVPAGSVTLRNTSSVAFDQGRAGATDVGPLPAGAELVVPLPLPAGRCADLRVDVWALDADHQVSAEAELADHVCDGDELTVEPEIVEIKTDDGWRPLVPEQTPSLPPTQIRS